MTVVLGITGGIAAYKAADLTSRLIKRGVDVRVIMTENAREFISAHTFEALTGHPVSTYMFGPQHNLEIEHIALAKAADLLAVVPATANIIGKLANGIADDMLSSTALACSAPLMIAPAMNTVMFESKPVQANLATLKERGAIIVEPASGRLACGDVGSGKLAPVEELEDAIMHLLYRGGANGKLLEGKRVLVTAGPTEEPIDPVRYISNRSSGKMGFAIADMATKMGAEVLLVAGPTVLRTPFGVDRIDVKTTAELEKACLKHADADIVVMAAAPADFASAKVSKQKIKYKKEGAALSLDLKLNDDIIAAIGAKKRRGQIVVAFAAETQDAEKNAAEKLKKKNADYIVVNDVTAEGAGFGTDTNIASILSADGGKEKFEKMSKAELAEHIFIHIMRK